MDIKELDKKQLILLTLLITFVVSIATGIVTVSLMNQMPKSVPQTINNVIQRTIEKVTTVEVPAQVDKSKENANIITESSALFSGNSEALVSIYSKDINIPVVGIDDTNTTEPANNNKPVSIGQGVIVSDIGLILVDSSILTDQDSYKVLLDKTYFDASILKKFANGFTVLKISPITVDESNETVKTDDSVKTQ